MKITRALILAAACVVLLPTAMPVRAASCNGASHEMSLSRGTASPGTGSPSTSILFSVLYTDNAGCAPSSITVTVASVGTFALAPGGTSAGGVTYRRAMTLPVGRHTYTFSATAGTGAGEVSAQLTSVSPAAVMITATVPKPSPVPTAPPTPRGTPAPTLPPPAASVVPTTPTANPSREGSEEPSAGPSATGNPSPTERPASGSPGPTAAHGASAQPSESDAASSPTSGGASPGPRAGAPFRIPFAGELIAYLALTTAGIAFFLFLVRQRNEPDGSRATAGAGAGSPLAGSPGQPVAAAPATSDRNRPVDPDLGPGAAAPARAQDDEKGIPRWLRPSVRAGRFDGVRTRQFDER